MTTDLRYPIGKFAPPASYTDASRAKAITVISAAPGNLRRAAQGLTDSQLDTPYRPGGWTVRQAIHHVPDSHMNAYIRTRLALTETNPTIKPYDETKWAELPDAKSSPIAPSLAMLEAIHERWIVLLRTLKPADFALPFTHPEHGPRTIDWLLALYEWHGAHHTGHITELRKREGW